MELANIRFSEKSPGKGILVPELWFTVDNDTTIYKATKDQNTDRRLSTLAHVPAEGITAIEVAQSEKYVTGLRFYS